MNWNISKSFLNLVDKKENGKGKKCLSPQSYDSGGLLSKASDLICLSNQANKRVKNQREYNSEGVKFESIMMIREGRK